MGIYRGPGGSGDATNDASSETRLAVEARDAAIAAKVAAETAQAAAELAETNAETAETNAETAETNAETAATNAASSASAASTSATNAAASASTATTQASNASSSASAASTSASNASSSASTATTQASNASTSATNASNSATAAAASATSAAASYDAFDDRYLGAKSSNPTVDNDGNALITGALYFNTVVPETRVWTGTVWNALSAAGSSVSTFNTRTGDVTLTSSDVTTALTYTPLAPSAIGTTVQAYDAQLADVAGLTPSDNGVIIGNGTNFVVESGATVRTSLGLGTAATTAATDYATSAQGAKADTALQPAAIGVSVQAYDADLAAFALKTAPTGAVVGTSDTQTLTNKTIALGSNTVSGTLAEFNTAVTDADFASIAGTETLTNKTLTSPTISGGTINNASVGATTASTGAFTSLSASGAFSANGGATLGDASGDALTINSSAVSIPNGLNFDSNTFVIDATNDRVGVGTASPTAKLDVNGLSVFAKGSTNGITIGDVTTNSNSVLRLQGTSAGKNFQIANNLNVGGLEFTPSTADGGTTYTTPSMVLTSAGNVGIGTTSPGYRLDVAGGLLRSINSYSAAYNSLIIQNTASNGYAQTLYFVGSDGASGAASVSYAPGIFFTIGPTANDTTTPIVFRNNNATERMRIDSSGNVGIGTSSPAGRLGITTSDALVVDINSTAASGGYMRYAASGTVYGYIGTSTGITGAGGTNALAVRSENSMMFATGGSSERMRIDSSGNLLVNTTSQFGNGVLNINTYRGVAVTGLMTQPSTNANYDAAGFRNSSGSYVGYISCTASATTYATSSDYRLKDNIAPMTGALDKVSLLKPCTYTWKLTGEESQGFIAHELAEVIPDCVTGEKDAVETYTDEDGVEQTRPKYQGIDTSFLVATLTAAIQEQQAIITAQADTISAMEARLTALEAK